MKFLKGTCKFPLFLLVRSTPVITLTTLPIGQAPRRTLSSEINTISLIANEELPPCFHLLRTMKSRKVFSRPYAPKMSKQHINIIYLSDNRAALNGIYGNCPNSRPSAKCAGVISWSFGSVPW